MHVTTGDEEGGTVAVCVPDPMETKAMFGPSLTIRTALPCAGNAIEVLAVLVTATDNVFDWALKGMGAVIFSPMVNLLGFDSLARRLERILRYFLETLEDTK